MKYVLSPTRAMKLETWQEFLDRYVLSHPKEKKMKVTRTHEVRFDLTESDLQRILGIKDLEYGFASATFIEGNINHCRTLQIIFRHTNEAEEQ